MARILRDYAQRARQSPLLRVASVRIITMPVTVLCGLLWLRVVIAHVSTADYALVAILVGLQFLLVFLDFGTTAHILNEAGRYEVDKTVDNLGRAIGQAWRTILIGNVAVLVVAAALSVVGVWGTILGFAERSSAAGLAVVLTLGINVVVRPLSIANALIAGLGRPTLAQWSQVVASLISLGVATTCVLANLPLAWIIASPILGQLVAALITMAASMRIVPGLLRCALRATAGGGGSAASMRTVAGPMLLIQVVGPLNSQLDRVILSHVSTVDDVAVYSLATQFLTSALTLITALFPTLWVQFAEQRVLAGDRVVAISSFQYVRRFWGGSVLFGAALAFGIWVLGPIVSGHEIELRWTLCLLLGATFPVFVIRNIFGLALADARGLRVQAAFSTLTTAVNLTLTVLLAARWGAVGPVVASLVAFVLDGLILAAVSRRRLHGGFASTVPTS